MLALLLVLAACGRVSLCWTTDDLAMFDLVEELDANFYQFLGVTKEASTNEIKRAYRALSLQWHPDKNDDPSAADMFRKIAAVYEVLKSDEQRQSYENVLEFGLPDWRQPIFYYRQVRKMPAWELALIVVLIFTLTHYLMTLGAYYEKKLALRETISSKLRRQEKRLRRKHNVDVDDLIDQSVEQQLYPRPGFADLLPFAVCRSLWYFARCVVPELVREYAEWRKAAQHVDDDDDDECKAKPVRQRVYIEEVQYEVASDIKPVAANVDLDWCKPTTSAEITTGQWSIDELNHLIKLTTVKFPVGTVDRWDKVADQLNRRADDVTQMIGKLKHMDPDDYHKLCKPLEPPAKYLPDASSSPTIAQEADNAWSQSAQSQLEAALARHGRQLPDRWDRVAADVDGKDRDECMARYKQLAALVRLRRAKAAQ